MNAPIDNQRYLRHTQIEGFSQEKIRNLHVLVIGCGAIGNEVVKNLVLLGVGQLTIFDFDRVEKHNLTRSVLLRETDIGLNKTDSVARHAQSLEPSVRINPIHGDIHDTLTVSMVRDADIVIGCTDNFSARIRINQLCWLTGSAWINTAIDARYASLELYPLNRPGNCACYECNLPQSVYEKLAERQSCGGLLRAAQAEHVMPTTTITTSLCGALASNLALGHTGCDSRADGNTSSQTTRIFIDSLTGVSTRSTSTQSDMCAGCGMTPRDAQVIGQASCGNDLAKLIDQPEQTTLLTSDKLIWGCACTNCGPSNDLSRFVGQRAASLTDAITVCAQCQNTSVKVDIREQFTAHELIAQFGATPIPGAFVLADDQLIELTEPSPIEQTNSH
jgi:molybdopterin/thiamine biosynthesis adenylyltransferase